MRLRPRQYRRARCCVLSITIVLLNNLSAFTQTIQTEWSFPTFNSPRVVISNASLISIVCWDKSEVSGGEPSITAR